MGLPSRSRRRTRSSATVFNAALSYQNRHPWPEGSLPRGMLNHLYCTCTRFLPIKCSTKRTRQRFSRQACPEQSRRDAKVQKVKSEFRISKPETNYDSNPKSRFRNSKQHSNLNYQNLKLFNSIVLKIRNCVIWICFDFQISCFEFFVLLLGVLCAFARECSYPIPLSCRAKPQRPRGSTVFTTLSSSKGAIARGKKECTTAF